MRCDRSVQLDVSLSQDTARAVAARGVDCERVGALARFRDSREALAGCFLGAIAVQAVLVAFYLAVALSMRIPVGFAELAVIVPITFIVQILPVSMV